MVARCVCVCVCEREREIESVYVMYSLCVRAHWWKMTHTFSASGEQLASAHRESVFAKLAEAS